MTRLTYLAALILIPLSGCAHASTSCVMLAPALTADTHSHVLGDAFVAWANNAHASDYAAGTWRTASGVVVGYAASEDSAVWSAPECGR